MIHTGSCLAWLRDFEERSIDVMIFDAPYSDHVHKNSRRAGNKERPRDKAKASISDRRELGFASLRSRDMHEVSRHAARATKRWVLSFCSAEMIGAWKSALEGAGLEHVRVGVWVKPNAAPQFTGDRPAANHEHIVIAHRKKVRKRWNGGGHGSVFTHCIEQRGRLHTTEKPVPLMTELVSLFSERGELVVDPFAGSGSTGVACVRLGRRFMGAELDPKVAELARERLAAESEGSSYAARLRGQVALFPDGGAIGLAAS